MNRSAMVYASYIYIYAQLGNGFYEATNMTGGHHQQQQTSYSSESRVESTTTLSLAVSENDVYPQSRPLKKKNMGFCW